MLEEINNAQDVYGDVERKRTFYKEEVKLKVAKFASQFGPSKAVKTFAKEFPKLSESTIRGWVTKYWDQIKNNPRGSVIKISGKRGHPLLLPNELDFKLQTFLVHLHNGGTNINCHVVYGVLMGLMKSDLNKYGSYLDFNVTTGWVKYLYRRMGFSRRMVTTSRPKINRAV